MTSVVGHRDAHAAFEAALRGGSLHHAWLLAGPEGVGKATFALQAALRMLAEAAGGPPLPPGLGVPDDHPTRALADAGSHPDFRVLSRAPKDPDKPDGEVARSIPIAQVRARSGKRPPTRPCTHYQILYASESQQQADVVLLPSVASGRSIFVVQFAVA